MTDADIINKGYKEYPPTCFHDSGVEKCYQKRFTDENGTRYFIDINKWRPMTHPHTGETFGPDYEYTVQMYKKNTHDALDLTFHSSWKLEDVENHVESLFNTGLYDYYED